MLILNVQFNDAVMPMQMILANIFKKENAYKMHKLQVSLNKNQITDLTKTTSESSQKETRRMTPSLV